MNKFTMLFSVLTMIGLMSLFQNCSSFEANQLVALRGGGVGGGGSTQLNWEEVNEKVLPIIDAKCLSCHNDMTMLGNLGEINNIDKMIAEKVIIPGNLSSSFYTEINEDKMPPGAPLATNEKALFAQWIQGMKVGSVEPLPISCNLDVSSVSIIKGQPLSIGLNLTGPVKTASMNGTSIDLNDSLSFSFTPTQDIKYEVIIANDVESKSCSTPLITVSEPVVGSNVSCTLTAEASEVPAESNTNITLTLTGDVKSGTILGQNIDPSQSTTTMSVLVDVDKTITAEIIDQNDKSATCQVSIKAIPLTENQFFAKKFGDTETSVHGTLTRNDQCIKCHVEGVNSNAPNKFILKADDANFNLNSIKNVAGGKDITSGDANCELFRRAVDPGNHQKDKRGGFTQLEKDLLLKLCEDY